MLFEFWKAGDATEAETQEAYNQALEMIEDAEFKATLNEPEDELPAVMQINAGAGVPKARTGQRCFYGCTVCMAKNKAGV